MNHGTATSKVAIDGIVNEGDCGTITAYLPDDPVFGVFFGEGRWHSFHVSEKEFHERFHVELNDPSLAGVVSH